MERTTHASAEAAGLNHEVRRYDDTTTWLAEVLEGSMRTPFEYSFDGRELYSHDGGPLGPVFKDAISEAKYLGPGLGFELRRRNIEYNEYKEMLDMARGNGPNTMIVVSDFPPELMSATRDIGGYNVGRKQTMLRVIHRTHDGKIHMRSQSLDGSDRNALESIYRNLGVEPQPGEMLGQRIRVELDQADQEFIMDRLMGVYDRMLSAQYGGEWYAGRSGMIRSNTYEFVLQQNDLLQAYMNRTKAIDNPSLLHDLAAAMRRRFEAGYAAPNVRILGVQTVYREEYALAEMKQAGQSARSRGEVFSGCGISVGGENVQSAEDELSLAGYGNKSQEDKFGPLRFRCPKGHWNKRPPAKSHKDFLTHCTTCRVSLKC